MDTTDPGTYLHEVESVLLEAGIRLRDVLTAPEDQFKTLLADIRIAFATEQVKTIREAKVNHSHREGEIGHTAWIIKGMDQAYGEINSIYLFYFRAPSFNHLDCRKDKLEEHKDHEPNCRLCQAKEGNNGYHVIFECQNLPTELATDREKLWAEVKGNKQALFLKDELLRMEIKDPHERLTFIQRTLKWMSEINRARQTAKETDSTTPSSEENQTQDLQQIAQTTPPNETSPTPSTETEGMELEKIREIAMHLYENRERRRPRKSLEEWTAEDDKEIIFRKVQAIIEERKDLANWIGKSCNLSTKRTNQQITTRLSNTYGRSSWKRDELLKLGEEIQQSQG
eukprot:GHVP01044836.1.p1 GENE.GHVP01044836.1~~GHVP01044836.1.p1  ORF type:complete len:341 (-),score=43.96 GHVP01044836.1:108-1130(-)